MFGTNIGRELKKKLFVVLPYYPIFSILSQDSCQIFVGWKHISRMCIKANIFNSLMIFVPNIWGWKHSSRMCIKPNIFNSLLIFVLNICWDGNILLGCV